MNVAEEDQAFLRDLVKTARQKHHRVQWLDRDGSERHTVLSPAEVTRLNGLAQKLGTSKSDLLRRAAHIPVGKPPAAPKP
jgi:hypothetical protein